MKLVSSKVILFFCLVSLTNCERNTIQKIKCYGFVEADELRLAFLVGGRISNMNFKEGEYIKTGDTIAALERIELELIRDLRMAELSGARASLEKQQAGLRNQEISRTYYVLKQNQTRLELIKENLLRIEALYEEGNVPRQDYDKALAEFQIAEAQTSASFQEFSLANEGNRIEDIEIAIEKVIAAEKSLELARLQVDRTYLISPVKGVVEELNYTSGEIVVAGKEVARISMLDTVTVNFWISGDQLRNIRLNQTVSVIFGTDEDDIFEGKILNISNEAEFSPSVVYTEDVRAGLVYEVKALVPNRNESLKSGMPVTIEIIY